MYEYKAVIRRVVDGDTVDVDLDLGFSVWLHDQRIRLLGIDTPETRTQDLQEKAAGKLATARVEEMLPVGSVQTIRTSKEKRGKFGRVLGDFPVGETTVCQTLIDECLAVAYHGQSKEDVRKKHLENRAYLQSIGALSAQ